MRQPIVVRRKKELAGVLYGELEVFRKGVTVLGSSTRVEVESLLSKDGFEEAYR